MITFDYVTEDVIRTYIKWVSDNKSVGTRNVRLAGIKAYVRYAARKDIELVPLEIALHSLKAKKVLPKKHNWMTKEQVLDLLEQPEHTMLGIRDRFIILFLFGTGVRVSELVSIQLKDFYFDGEYPYIRITGKGDKPRIIPISDKEFLENLHYYCSLYHKNNDPQDYLFYTTKYGEHRKMSADNIQRILKKYGMKCEKIDNTVMSVHPHLLRHSYGAQMYRSGLSLPEIALLLGHEHTKTTEIYAETDANMAAEALKKTLGERTAERMWDSLTEEEKLKALGLK
jgi:site-specific recombinase XerD